MFMKIACRPIPRISEAIRSALGSVPLRSRWTPKTFIPARASATEAEPPNPLDAPRIKAHPSSCSGIDSPFRGSRPSATAACTGRARASEL